MTISLRDYQQELLDCATGCYRAGNRRVLLVAPTGSGKSVMIAHVAQNSNCERVLILAHREELLQQISDKISEPHDTLRAGDPDPTKRIVVASVHTATKRNLPYFDLIIPDEAHHCTARTWTRIFDSMRGAWMLGVTATPCRMDGRGLGDVFEALAIGPGVRELTAEGWLVPATVYAPPAQVDTARLRTVRGDYDRQQSAVSATAIVGDVIEHYQRHAPGKRAVVFCASVKHSREMAVAFEGRSIDGGMHADERREIVDRFRREGGVLCSCDLISEGFDLPAIECAILLRPTQSAALYLQQVGRALRPYPGKDRAIILDHVGNSRRFGLPDAPREWVLSSGRRATIRVAPLKRCPECYAMYETAECPNGCTGAVVGRSVRHRDGELVLATDIPVSPYVSLPYRDALRMARQRGELEVMARERGYSVFWANRMANMRRKARMN